MHSRFALMLGLALAAGPAAAASPDEPVTRPVAPETAPAMPAAALMGRPVADAGGTAIGAVTDVLLARDAYPQRLVVALKPGKREVAVDTARVEMLPDQTLRVAGLKPEELAALPDREKDAEVALSSARKR